MTLATVRRNLEAPNQFPGVGVEGDDAAGPGIVAGTDLAIQHRRGIAGTDIHQIEKRIVGAGHPHLSAGSTAALRLRCAGRRRAVEDPLGLAGIGIDGFQLAGHVIEIAGDADQNVISDDERSVGGPETPAGIGDHDVPLDGAILGVEGDQMAVGGGQVDGVLVNVGAAMADVERAVAGMGVVPNLLRGAGVNGPEVVGRGEVEDAVRQNGRGLDGLILAGLEAPDLL